MLLVYYSVFEFSEFGGIPAAGCTYEVAGDALELVNIVAAAVWAFFEVLVGVLEAAVHTSVAIVVD